ncbi:E3 ubiquitin-protein ligase TRIM39 [Nothobranchius furzeri]|uniref:B30.2/SPRY domain-containing protein n=1 Tax=Nothobranchius furzeri TaxID=105023 RepID=A0A1A8A479_NOTFU
MAAALPPLSDSLVEKHLLCSICMETFTNPVTTSCGHTFCKKCLDLSMLYSDQMCPLCKKYFSKIPEVNIVLREVIQQIKVTKGQRSSGAVGEVLCDTCINPKLRAKKSCLMCLTSYCETHLENHKSLSRLKGHKLVEPVEMLDRRACLEHGRALELYSRTRQKCICVQCLREGQDEVISAEEECNRKKTQLGNTKTELQQKIQTRKTKIDEIKKALKSCQREIEDEWWDIDAVFTAVTAILDAALATLLRPLDERKLLLEQEADGLKEKLDTEILELSATVSELDNISVLEDHILFLQKYPSLSIQNEMRDWTNVELDTSLSFGTMRDTIITLVEEIQQEVEKLTTIELRRVPKFRADVKLDPNTAHQRLVLSDDGKEVKDGGQDQEVTDTPERFDLFGSVLGINNLSNQRSYWEVEVSNKPGWDLGVAKGGANRKGGLTLSPDNGYWILVHYEGETYAAMSSPPTRLSINNKPMRVGVFVDYEKSVVSFYDVTAQSHIYTFKDCLFSDGLYPYFSPHMMQEDGNVEPLVIRFETKTD